jgi:hypothetical protein
MRQLRKVLAGSKYQIVNYRSLGYELLVASGRAGTGTIGPTQPVTLTDTVVLASS